jgi:cystathionine beta-lyase
LMIYDFDTLPNRRKTDSIKWEYYPEDVLPLWVADMDFVSPEPVIRALHERVDHGIFGYPGNIAQKEGQSSGLAEVLIQRLAERYGWQVQPGDLVFIPGVVAGFHMACHTLAAHPEEDHSHPGGVLIQTPVYPPFLGAAAVAGMVRQEMELTLHPDGSYTIDWEAFEAAFTPDTRMFLLCNPHNPVGRVFRQDELERMAEICLRHGVIICSDEIHCDLLFAGQRHIPIASLNPETAHNTITLMAPSKTYNIAGLGCAVAVIQNESLRRRYRQAHMGLVHGVNALGWAAAIAAYRDGQEWLDQLLGYLEANRDCLYDFVQRELPGVKMAKPEGTYLAWLDCREAGLDSNPYEFFLQQAKVALNDGKTFGRGGEGFVRLNFGCPRSMLLEALERMKKALVSTGVNVL